MSKHSTDRIATFRSRLGRWQELVKDRADELTRGVAEVMYDNVQDGGDYSPGTPIEDGTARSAWSVTVRQLGSIPPADSPQTARQRALAAITQAKAGDPVFVLNTAAHIRRLEFGSSEQAPQGFVRVAANSTPAIATHVVRAILARGESRGNS